MYFIDVQGTLISDKDKRPIKGSIEFIQKLQDNNLPFLLITNNTKQSSEEFFEYLRSLGFNIQKRHYIDPLMVLSEVLPKGSVAAYGTKEFLDNLVSLGYTLDFDTPEYVVVAIKKDFESKEYAEMIEFLLAGAKLIGMHETALYAKDGKRYPGVGAILKMLSFATQKSYEVVGKPSELFYQKALSKLQEQDKDASFEKVTIISDDVVGDLVGAKELGMKTIFVTSGKFKSADEIIPNIDSSKRPDRILKDISEML
ncbi:NagD, Predicted sugar phosphatases of the HAD superfamily [hydrothermal vent metagenome]|uniref:NagD, Predicted sugar phosphatases of the HAD superfamily n=1 Tax=hydrothermal vent metagenome TaxID=652676 RepID=A0A1W1C503_9ZZZZ